VTEMDIVQLIYRPMEPLGAFKDFEFSRSTMTARWKQGLSDVPIPCRLRRGSHRCRRNSVHVMHDILTGRPEPV
jgi:Patatin phospholipase